MPHDLDLPPRIPKVDWLGFSGFPNLEMFQNFGADDCILRGGSTQLMVDTSLHQTSPTRRQGDGFTSLRRVSQENLGLFASKCVVL